jgi:AbrB family looped-hinge helix DNA binding protein
MENPGPFAPYADARTFLVAAISRSKKPVDNPDAVGKRLSISVRLYSPPWSVGLPARFLMKLARIGNSLRVTIPKPAVDGLGWKEGDVLILTTGDDEIRIRKARGKRGAR